MSNEEIKSTIKAFIAATFLPGESPDEINDETRFVTDGILDSLGSLQLVAFVEKTYKVKIAAHEVDVEYLDSLDTIAALIRSKLA